MNADTQDFHGCERRASVIRPGEGEFELSKPQIRDGRRPCPESGKGVHHWLAHAAPKLAMAGVDSSKAENWITANMTRPPSPPNEVATTIQKGFLANSTYDCSAAKLSKDKLRSFLWDATVLQL
jgi:hypothetical protein